MKKIMKTTTLFLCLFYLFSLCLYSSFLIGTLAHELILVLLTFPLIMYSLHTVTDNYKTDKKAGEVLQK